MSTQRPLELFTLGETVITRNAQESLTPDDIREALARHRRGDWGEVPPEDAEENELSLKEGFRLLSAYRSREGTRFWVITEACRSVTTILLPEDY